MENIKVSVVLPCYNVEKYIRRGLDSVLAQTLSEWEAILVDDGATDSTGRICDEYAQKDSRFHVIHTQNQGVSCARNTGMKETQGELLYFMDPDDWIEPNCFERCYETYKKYGCEIVHFAHYWCSGKGRTADNIQFKVVEGKEILREYTGPISGLSQTALDHYYKGEFIWKFKMCCAIWNFIFDRKFILSIGLEFVPGLRIFEDVMFVEEASLKIKKIVRIPDVLYNYNMREDGALLKRKSSLAIFENKYNLIQHRHRLREMVTDFDLHDYYLGSHVLSSLQLALQISDKWSNYTLYRKYVLHPDVQESIKKVKIGNAPLKFSIPVFLLKLHLQIVLFAACKLLYIFGASKKISM